MGEDTVETLPIEGDGLDSPEPRVISDALLDLWRAEYLGGSKDEQFRDFLDGHGVTGLFAQFPIDEAMAFDIAGAMLANSGDERFDKLRALYGRLASMRVLAYDDLVGEVEESRVQGDAMCLDSLKGSIWGYLDMQIQAFRTVIGGETGSHTLESLVILERFVSLFRSIQNHLRHQLEEYDVESVLAVLEEYIEIIVAEFRAFMMDEGGGVVYRNMGRIYSLKLLEDWGVVDKSTSKGSLARRGSKILAGQSIAAREGKGDVTPNAAFAVSGHKTQDAYDKAHFYFICTGELMKIRGVLRLASHMGTMMDDVVGRFGAADIYGKPGERSLADILFELWQHAYVLEDDPKLKKWLDRYGIPGLFAQYPPDEAIAFDVVGKMVDDVGPLSESDEAVMELREAYARYSGKACAMDPVDEEWRMRIKDGKAWEERSVIGCARSYLEGYRLKLDGKIAVAGDFIERLSSMVDEVEDGSNDIGNVISLFDTEIDRVISEFRTFVMDEGGGAVLRAGSTLAQSINGLAKWNVIKRSEKPRALRRGTRKLRGMIREQDCVVETQAVIAGMTEEDRITARTESRRCGTAVVDEISDTFRIYFNYLQSLWELREVLRGVLEMRERVVEVWEEGAPEEPEVEENEDSVEDGDSDGDVDGDNDDGSDDDGDGDGADDLPEVPKPSLRGKSIAICVHSDSRVRDRDVGRLVSALKGASASSVTVFNNLAHSMHVPGNFDGVVMVGVGSNLMDMCDVDIAERFEGPGNADVRRELRELRGVMNRFPSVAIDHKGAIPGVVGNLAGVIPA